MSLTQYSGYQIYATLISAAAAVFDWIAQSEPELARDVELWEAFETLEKCVTSPFAQDILIGSDGDLVLQRIDEASFRQRCSTAAQDIRYMKKRTKGLSERLERLAKCREQF